MIKQVVRAEHSTKLNKLIVYLTCAMLCSNNLLYQSCTIIWLDLSGFYLVGVGGVGQGNCARVLLFIGRLRYIHEELVANLSNPDTSVT